MDKWQSYNPPKKIYLTLVFTIHNQFHSPSTPSPSTPPPSPLFISSHSCSCPFDSLLHLKQIMQKLQWMWYHWYWSKHSLSNIFLFHYLRTNSTALLVVLMFLLLHTFMFYIRSKNHSYWLLQGESNAIGSKCLWRQGMFETPTKKQNNWDWWVHITDSHSDWKL